MPRATRLTYTLPATPRSPSPYTLSDAMLAAIRERGTSDAPTMRALADEFHVPFYWMKEQVLAHGRGVDHERLAREIDLEARTFTQEALSAPERPTPKPEPEPLPEPDDTVELGPTERRCAEPTCRRIFDFGHNTKRQYCSRDCSNHGKQQRIREARAATARGETPQPAPQAQEPHRPRVRLRAGVQPLHPSPHIAPLTPLFSPEHTPPLPPPPAPEGPSAQDDLDLALIEPTVTEPTVTVESADTTTSAPPQLRVTFSVDLSPSAARLLQQLVAGLNAFVSALEQRG